MFLPEAGAGEQLQSLLRSRCVRHVCLLLSIAVIGACAPDAPPTIDLVERLPVPDGAQSVSRIELDRNPHRQQLYFTVQAAYPTLAPLDRLRAHYSQASWAPCAGKSPSWDSFLDTSTNPAHRVHQSSAAWVSPDGRVLTIAIGRYVSKHDAKLDKPDNDEQRWAIVVHRNIDARKEAAAIGFACA